MVQNFTMCATHVAIFYQHARCAALKLSAIQSYCVILEKSVTLGSFGGAYSIENPYFTLIC